MKTYLNVPFAQKDEAKRRGARWDGVAKRWYVKDVDDIGKFMRWVPEHLTRPASFTAGGPWIKPKVSNHEKRKAEHEMRVARAKANRNR